jgi:hypothetical protein
MATRRYGLSKGDTEFQVTEDVGSATSSDSIELTVDFDAAAKPDKEDVLLALDMMKNHILKGIWPPA